MMLHSLTMINPALTMINPALTMINPPLTMINPSLIHHQPWFSSFWSRIVFGWSAHPILNCPGVPQRPDKGPAPGDPKWDPIKGRYPAPPPESVSVTWTDLKSGGSNGAKMGMGDVQRGHLMTHVYGVDLPSHNILILPEPMQWFVLPRWEWLRNG